MATIDPLLLEKLLARSALGDHQAFAATYQLASPQLLGVILRILPQRARAEEVLQEAFVSIWTHAGEYRASLAAPMTWMTTIARNKALDVLRQRKHQELTLEDSETHFDIADEAQDPLGLFDRACHTMRIANCMQTLNPAQRQALALAYYHGLSHAELAAHMTTPLGTIKTWVRRGLERMKHCLNSLSQPQSQPAAEGQE
ncbi:sigma-70 family RNA polymerase sigma factor [Parvibium lacunae]|uniref:RNA polymerase subunit sigma-24 n=1 Tax=Parvibium lacunae TaxID=1888893 RepID=A0A368L7N5_9BURK|nr:sigma-70 family RNA polymerase sigma factor [Parvibium lacunae]RCS59680.1 RNA polymerase subunit sigma-24 [Parvibium lacunae]